MEDYLRECIEDGEKLLWAGGSTSGKVMDATYRVPYLIRLLISHGIVLYSG